MNVLYWNPLTILLKHTSDHYGIAVLYREKRIRIGHHNTIDSNDNFTRMKINLTYWQNVQNFLSGGYKLSYD